MIAVRMVRARNISVDETADILIRCPSWVRNWLRRYDEGGLEGLRDLPRCGRPRRILRNVMDEIIANVAGCRITPMGLQQYIRAQTGTRTSHHVRQEDNAPVQPVSKGSAEDTHQQGRQEGSLELEVLPQTANFVPRKGWICRDHAG